MAAATTNDQFLDFVRRSALIGDAQLSHYLSTLADSLPSRPNDLAENLVRDGLLTRFQARQLLAGKHRGFLIASGKYKLLEVLGVGGMGKVYLCEHLRMHRLVAVKVLPADSTKDPSALDRFNREAQAAASLDHINIVRAHDIDTEGSMHFLIMEYVDGSSLQEIVKRFGPMDVIRACHYISQAAEGLQHAHEAGWVHRDIKPGNLLLDRGGCVKILDMGLARCFAAAGGTDPITKQHKTNSVLGTADYLSPEQAVNSSQVDIRADIYSLGATFYFLLTGRAPFEEGTIAEKLIWHQMRTPTAVRQLQPHVPAEVEAVVNKMMAKKPNHRYPTPEAVVLALQKWTERPIEPPPEEEMPQLCQAVEQYHTPLPSGSMVGVNGPSSGRLRVPRATKSSSYLLKPGPMSRSRIMAPPPPKRWPWIVAAMAAGVAAFAAAFAIALYVNAPDTPAAQPAAPQMPRGSAAAPTVTPIPPPTAVPAGGSLVVHKLHASSGSAFASLADALAVVKPGQVVVIRDELVEGPVTIADPQQLAGVRIQGDLPGGRPVTWRAAAGQSATEPLLMIQGVPGVQLIGLTFDGQRRLHHLVDVSGPCPGCRFNLTNFTDFRSAGLILHGGTGSADLPIQVDHCRFTTTRDYTQPVNFGQDFILESALSLRPGRDGSDCRHVLIDGNRFEGMFRSAVALVGGCDAVIRLNRFYTLKDEERPATIRDCTAVKLSPSVEVPARLLLTSNTAARYPALLQLESVPPSGSSVRLRSNLMVGGTAWVTAPNGGHAAKLRPIFDGSAGNVCRPGTCTRGLDFIPRNYIPFHYFDVSLASDAKFLRYPAQVEDNGQLRPHELMNAGADGEPAGVPPAR